MTNKKHYIAIVIATLIACGIAFYNCTGSKKHVTMGGSIWFTEYHISYHGDPALQDPMLPMLNELENSMSIFLPNSVISRINNNSTDQADSVFIHLYKVSRKVYEDTGGAFDPTITPLMQAWGFVEDTQINPTQEDIDSLLHFVGMNKTYLKGSTVVKDDPRIRFDFSSFAKGYGCDMVAEVFRRNGVKDFIVEIGGEIVASGVNSEGKPWQVAIDKPEMQQDTVVHTVVRTIELTDASMATSGNYRNFKVVDNRYVSHIIDPHTGYSTTSDMLSASVIAKDCTVADAYSTAFMVMGFEASRAIIQGRKDLKAYFIYCDSSGEIQQWSSEDEE